MQSTSMKLTVCSGWLNVHTVKKAFHYQGSLIILTRLTESTLKPSKTLVVEMGFLSKKSGLNKMQYPLKCKDLTFFMNGNDYNDDLMMFWISFCGTKKEAELYEYTIKIVSSAEKKAGRTQYLFTGSRRCVSCDVSHKDMKKTTEALFVGKDLMRKAAEGHDEKRLQWRLIVQQL